MTRRLAAVCLSALVALAGAPLYAGQDGPGSATPPATGTPAEKAAPKPVAGAKPATGTKPADTPAGVTPPDDYIIGAEDVLTIIFWRDKEMSGDVIVRPDGKITLPLLNDIMAAGLTPDQLRERITSAAERFLEDPAATVVVKQINSRKVFITGEVAKPGPYPLIAPTTVLHLIAMAGGLAEYAHREDIVIMRMEGGRPVTFPFDYAAVSRRKKLEQNILLRPGDTVVVP